MKAGYLLYTYLVCRGKSFNVLVGTPDLYPVTLSSLVAQLFGLEGGLHPDTSYIQLELVSARYQHFPTCVKKTILLVSSSKQ